MRPITNNAVRIGSVRASSIGQYIARPALAMKYAVNCSKVLRMKRLLMSTGELAFGTRPTNWLGSSRCAATKQIPMMPGTSATTASLITRARRSAMPQASGVHVQKYFAAAKKAAANSQLPTSVAMNGHCMAVKPRCLTRGSRRLAFRRTGDCRCETDRCMFPFDPGFQASKSRTPGTLPIQSLHLFF